MKLIVVDGFSLAFRAFFAIPVETMVTSSGQPTNALYGFLSMIDGLLETQKPTHMAVALDLPGPTFRDDLNPNYKGHRPDTHPGLISQLELLERAITSLGISVVSAPQYEADDVLATLAEMGKNRSIETILVTGDRDSFQLVEDPYIKVLYNRRGVSDYLLLDEAGVLDKVAAVPSVYAFLAALRGDPSDNLFGVPGVGAKTAAKLAMDYLNPDTLSENIGALSPKLAQSISDNMERVLLNYSLTKLVRDIDLKLDLEDLALAPIKQDVAKEFFDFMESKRLYDRTIGAFSYLGTNTDNKTEIMSSNTSESNVTLSLAGSLDEFLDFERQDKMPVSINVEYQGEAGRSQVVRLFMARRTNANEVLQFVLDIDSRFEESQIRDAIRNLSETLLIGFSLKELFRRCLGFSIALPKHFVDLGLSAYLIDSTLGGYDPLTVIEHFCGASWIAPQSVMKPKEPKDDLFTGAGVVSKDDMEYFSYANLTLWTVLSHELGEAKLTWLFEDVELPLLVVLAKMEAYGIAVDRQYLVDLKDQYIKRAKELSDEIQSAAGRSFNVNSPKQVAEVLFQDLKLLPPKKTKTGFSTDAQTLEKLREDHPIIPLLLSHREIEKLRSTYGETLIAEIAKDQRIHASFNQMVARTGRLSSDHPNLHNIPIRSEEGKKFRFAFVAPPGSKLIVADYSQIELRVIAHLSGDPGLINAFSTGVDIHNQTAAAVFGVPPEHVTPQQRAKAKMVAYGLAYGMEAYGLAMRLNIPVPEADSILKSFFEAFPSVRNYMTNVIKDARRDGYTETEFGRRRKLSDILDTNFRIRQGAERQAMNAGIQGLAADIFKIALVKLDGQLDGLTARIVLQVHDEVIVECIEESADAISQIVTSSLEGAASLRVALLVNSYIVDRWGDAK